MNYKYPFSIQVFLLVSLISSIFPLLSLFSSYDKISEYSEVFKPFITQNIYRAEETISLPSLMKRCDTDTSQQSYLVFTREESSLDGNSIQKKKSTLCVPSLLANYCDTNTHCLLASNIKNQKLFDASLLLLACRNHELTDIAIFIREHLRALN